MRRNVVLFSLFCVEHPKQHSYHNIVGLNIFTVFCIQVENSNMRITIFTSFFFYGVISSHSFHLMPCNFQRERRMLHQKKNDEHTHTQKNTYFLQFNFLAQEFYEELLCLIIHSLLMIIKGTRVHGAKCCEQHKNQKTT